ncbi:MAG: prolyl oligopeptidase family serine peptidase [Clostridia bacterium]|nr:prolyl oligopeptidase family serine peptidase [Clostridia bacterium]
MAKITETASDEVKYEYEKEDGLLAHWAFDSIDDGIVRDVSGNGRDAEVIGTPSVVKGVIYNGIEFTEAGQKVVVKNAPWMNFTCTDSFTFEAWCRLTSRQRGVWPCVMHKGLDVKAHSFRYLGFWISGDGHYALGMTGNGGTGCYNAVASVTADGEWHRLTAVQNGETRRISFYVDGKYQCVAPSVDMTNEYDLIIGDGGENNQFFGAVDEVRIYDRAIEMNDEIAGVDKMTYESITYTAPDGESLTLPYRAYLPSDYSPDKKYPLLLFLHGFGECGTDNMQQIRVLGGANKMVELAVECDRLIVIAPQCLANPARYNWVPIDQKWKTGSRELTPEPTISLAAAKKLLDEYIAMDSVDEDRVYISGISMGGYGTWEMLARWPEVFAAAVPVCGSGIPSLAYKLTDIAIWAMHGEDDGTVPPKGTHDMEQAIKAAGGKKIRARYYEGVGHNVWLNAYAEPELMDWLLSQSRKKQ